MKFYFKTLSIYYMPYIIVDNMKNKDEQTITVLKELSQNEEARHTHVHVYIHIYIF